MIKLAPFESCTGCTACMNSCSHNAIVMAEDAEGFIFPHINGNKCVECGLCMRVCPVLNTPIITNATKPNVFAVWSLKDRTVSSSGGAFSAFARNVLEADGVVFGATLGTNLLCYHREIHMIEELEVLRGSKYVQSELRDTFFKVKAYLKEGKNVLFTGTPCQVDGLYRYLRRNYDNLLTLDLVCHGVPSNTLFHSYLLKLEDLKKVKISMFEFRRRNGWGFASAISDRGKLEPIYDIENLYMYAFDKAVLFRKSCYACPYARLPRVGDCSIADFWGIGRHGKSFKHNVLKGVSLVLANNAKGINAVQNLQESFVEERTLDEALAENYNIIHPSPLHPMRDKIITAFLDSSRSLKSINKEFELIDNSLKERVKEYASRYHIYDLLKNIYNKYKAL